MAGFGKPHTVTEKAVVWGEKECEQGKLGGPGLED